MHPSFRFILFVVTYDVLVIGPKTFIHKIRELLPGKILQQRPATAYVYTFQNEHKIMIMMIIWRAGNPLQALLMS